MTGFTSVVFDLDGTLVDSSHDIATALNRVLTPRGGSALTAQQVVPLLGEGVRQLVKEALAASGLGGADVLVEEIAGEYVAAYREHPVVDSLLYPEVEEALDALGAHGIPMAVCTNKNEAIAHQVLAGLGIAEHFPVVVGGDRLTNCKPHPDHLLLAFAELGCSAAEGLLVGDSPIDEQCATDASVAFRAVAWAVPAVTGRRLTSLTELVGLVAEQPDTTTPTKNRQERA